MDYRIEKRGAFQVVCKRKRVDKPQSGTATREISDMRQEFGANGTPERLIGSKKALWRAHVCRVLQVFRLDLRSKSPGSDRLRLRLLLLLRHALRASAKQQRQRQNAAADV